MAAIAGQASVALVIRVSSVAGMIAGVVAGAALFLTASDFGPRWMWFVLGAAGAFGAGAAGDTASYRINGGPVKALDLSAVGAGVGCTR